MNNANSKKPRNRKKNKGSGKAGTYPANTNSKPTVVLKANVLISQTITAVNAKQINIIPTLSICSNDILRQCADY